MTWAAVTGPTPGSSSKPGAIVVTSSSSSCLLFASASVRSTTCFAMRLASTRAIASTDRSSFLVRQTVIVRYCVKVSGARASTPSDRPRSSAMSVFLLAVRWVAVCLREASSIRNARRVSPDRGIASLCVGKRRACSAASSASIRSVLPLPPRLFVLGGATSATAALRLSNKAVRVSP